MNLRDIHSSTVWFTTAAAIAFAFLPGTPSEAAPIQQGTNIEEGACETVSVGQYFCKINGNCYYCDTKTNPDPNKNCRSTTCAAATMSPGFKGAVRPYGGRAPIMRRGVEGEQPSSEENKEPSAPPASK